MLTSAPVSIRKCAPEMVSFTCKRDTFVVGLAAEKLFNWRNSGRFWSFPGSEALMKF